ncbi:MAG: class I SAM-dependent methyltransferase [Candidatus Nanoarchaeia archaeon]
MRAEISNYDTSKALKIRKNENKNIFKNRVDFNQKILDCLGNEKNLKVLDAGCGNGDFLEFVHKQKPNWALYGFDISKGMIQEAKKETNKKIKYSVATVQKIPFKDETFDVVIAKHMLYHAEDIQKAIKEMHRVLKKEGVLIITLNSLANKSRANVERYKKHIQKILNVTLVETITRINMENYDKYVGKNDFRILQLKTYFAYAEIKKSIDMINYLSSYKEFYVPTPSNKVWGEVLQKLDDKINLEITQKGKINEVRGQGIIILQKI